MAEPHFNSAVTVSGSEQNKVCGRGSIFLLAWLLLFEIVVQLLGSRDLGVEKLSNKRYYLSLYLLGFLCTCIIFSL